MSYKLQWGGMLVWSLESVQRGRGYTPPPATEPVSPAPEVSTPQRAPPVAQYLPFPSHK